MLPSPPASRTLSAALLLLGLVSQPAAAHIALWHPSMWGFNGTATGRPANYNNNNPVNPLRTSDNYTQDQWFHRFIDEPPLDGDVMVLHPGKTQTFELGCNRAFTSYSPQQPGRALNTYACVDDDIGPLHTINEFGSPPDDRYLGGCALAIAYTGSDPRDISPFDFTIFSVNHTCVWHREIAFEIPAQLPACPPGGCLCSWHWVHTAGNYNAAGRTEGYSAERYMNTYRCNVTASRSPKRLAPNRVPRLCEGSPAACVSGAKQPLYWAQASGNTLRRSELAKPPTYNARWGFANGAQADIFSDTDGGSGGGGGESAGSRRRSVARGVLAGGLGLLLLLGV